MESDLCKKITNNYYYFEIFFDSISVPGDSEFQSEPFCVLCFPLFNVTPNMLSCSFLLAFRLINLLVGLNNHMVLFHTAFLRFDLFCLY